MAVRDNVKGQIKDHKLYNTEITHKEFGAGDKNGHDAATWSNREIDWYNAERRFIFAAKTENLRRKWIEEVVKEKASMAVRRNFASIGKLRSKVESPHSPVSNQK